MYSPKVVRQLGRPQGILGRLILNRLNAVNVGMNEVTYTSLDLDASDRVLEVGFGGGALLHKILHSSACKDVAATDLSDLAVSRAKKIFKNAIDAGSLELTLCSDHVLPYESGRFSKVCCVNVIYFWPDAKAALSEIHRTLSDQGRLVLTYCEVPPDRTAEYSTKRVGRLLRSSGFAVESSVSGSDKENGTYHCTVLKKATGSRR